MMSKIDANNWACDFGSGSRISICLNLNHVVIAVDEGVFMRTSIALTPATLHALATRLLLLAEVYDPALRDGRSIFLPAAGMRREEQGT